MTVKELEQLMIDNALIIRAVPKKVVQVFEKSHLKDFPNGKVQYIEDYKREMLVVETVPKNAGKFLIGKNIENSSIVRYEGQVYDSIEEAVNAVLML